MVKLLFYIIKLAILIAAAVWLAEQEGHVRAEAFGYIIETQLGVALALLLLLCIVFALLYHGWKELMALPRAMRRYHEKRIQEKGMRALTQGLASITAGDAKQAKKLAQRTKKLIPDEPLTKLLMAQAASQNGDIEQARHYYRELMADKEAAFFGVRGLLDDYLQAGNHDAALALVKKADAIQPKTPWLIKTMFDLHIQARDWQGAEDTLYRGKKIKLFDRNMFDEKLRAIYLARADLALASNDHARALENARKAWKIDKDFIPSIVLYSDCLNQDGAKSKAQRLIVNAWKKQPHHNLAQIWKKFRPHKASSDKEKDILAPVRWIEKLIKGSKEDALSDFYLGEAYAQAEMWAEAKRYLEKANLKEEMFKAIDLLEKIYSKLGEHKKAEQMAARAEKFQPRQWICNDCHHHSLNWLPVCPNCGSFNKISWRRGSIKLKASRSYLT